MGSRFATKKALVLAALIFPVAAFGGSEHQPGGTGRVTAQSNAEVIGVDQGPSGQAAGTDGKGGLQVKMQNGVEYVSGDGQQFTKVAYVNSAGQEQLAFIWPGQPQDE
jgi:hypothetical protein